MKIMTGNFDPVSSHSIEEVADLYDREKDVPSKIRQAMMLASRLSCEKPDDGNRYWQELKIMVENQELQPELQGEFYQGMSNICRSYSNACKSYEEEGCRAKYLKKAMDSFDRKNRNLEQGLWVRVELAGISSEKFDDRSAWLDEAVETANLLDLSDDIFSIINIARSHLYEEKSKIYVKDLNDYLDLAEKHLIAAMDSNRESLNVYQKRDVQIKLINFYIRNNRKEKALDKTISWISNQDVSIYQGGRIQNDLNYIATQLLMNSDTDKALFHLERVMPVNGADKVELALARILMNEKRGIQVSEKKLNEIKEYVKEVENEYEWASLSSYINFKNNNEDDALDGTESSFSEQYPLSKEWYLKMGEMIARDEFSFVADKLQLYSENTL
ncbi:hypothetical protein [Desulfamplus magnetovallimortis]|uniref:hypothetical protein n=1 Tax=Desulfamplus magnetovallimortis TaxID=1246637 RepID=UPI00111BAE1C|nr:hypothetical protein [Desulfamplus magnetovallimortis]